MIEEHSVGQGVVAGFAFLGYAGGVRFRHVPWPAHSPFDPVEHPRQPSQWRVRQPAEHDVIPSVWSCRVLLDVAQLLRCDVCDVVFLLPVHVLREKCPKVLEHLFVGPVGALVHLCPRSRHDAVRHHRVGVQRTFLVCKKLDGSCLRLSFFVEIEASCSVVCQPRCKEFPAFLVLVEDQSLHMLFDVSYGSV